MTFRLFPCPPALRSAAALVMLAACTDQGSPTGGSERAEAGPSAAPQVQATSSPTLVPGQAVTLTGVNFHPVADSNAVRIGGVQATVTGGGATSLRVVVPCVPSGPAMVQVDRGGVAGVPVPHHVRAPRRTLAVGQSLVLAGEGEAECNEITASGGDSRYVLAVYNTSTDPSSAAGFKLSVPGGSPATPATVHAAAPAPSSSAAPSLSAAELPQGRDAVHGRIMEMNRREHARLRARAGTGARMQARAATAAAAGPPPLTRTIRVVDIQAGTCDRFYTVQATRVYYDGKIAIYEDDASPAWVKAAANPRMQAYYQAIGEDFNATSEPILRRSFGDPLLRDGDMDANGVMVALFTPLLNTVLGGVPAFVVSCDLFPNEEGNAASNHGEFLYGFQPTVNGTGFFSGLTPENWYSNIRSGIIHEAKHLAALSARVAVDADFDEPWLEEGTARHAEELWTRQVLYDAAWKGNTGYGGESRPNSIYCDIKRTAACLGLPGGPTIGLFRHLHELSVFMRYPYAFSAFGSTPAGGASFYGTSWSLVRYAIDRYGASDEAFLTALTSSTATGTENLAMAAGVPLEELMGGWALALYADDYPGLARPSPTLQMPTWNLRDIYGGLHGHFGFTFPTPYPLVPHALAFGEIPTVDVPSVAGGGVAYFELSGKHVRGQVLRLRGRQGEPLPSTLRLAIARLQ
jgi:hypothetical protein